MHPLARCTSRLSVLLAASMLLSAGPAAADPLADTPAASVDLTVSAGAELLAADWRYSDVRIVTGELRAPDAAGQPTGAPVETYDYSPHAGTREFDDSGWERIAPADLAARRAGGLLCFNWYRVRLTVPERIGDFDPTGSLMVFETSLDDYAEVWVDGELPRAFGQNGGSVVAGWNAPNRLVIGRGVMPGQQIQLAIFGINGPISAAPTNFIWLRSARVDFYPNAERPIAVVPQEVNVEVVRIDPAIDALIPENAKVFKLAEGFTFTEGPVWTPDGELYFSDPNENRIYRYHDRGAEPGQLSVFLEPSGYDGDDIDRYFQPGSNGLALGADGRLLVNQHGNRRVVRLEADGRVTPLASQFEGHRLNSPNDLVVKRDGTIYFTDPPFGLPLVFRDPSKELAFSGIFRIHDGSTELLAKELDGPNGLAFSPDEKFLYVSNWDPERKVVMRYPVRADGSLGRGTVFFDMTGAPEEEALDGLKVDERGNLYVSGPGGLWVVSSEGRHLGTIRLPRLPANFAFGGTDGRTLYLTARSALYRMPLKVAGADRAATRTVAAITPATGGR